MGNSRGYIGLLLQLTAAEAPFIVDILLRAFRNPGHRLESLYRIISGRRLTAEHNGAGTVINGVSDIGGFGTGGTRVFHHGIQHLCSSDYLQTGVVCFMNQFLLNNGNLFKRDLYAKIAAGNHDAVGYANNFIDIFDAVGILNFRNNSNVVAIVTLKLRFHVENILRRSGEGSSDEFKIFLNGKSNIRFVLFTQEGERELDAGNVDALPGGNRASVDNCTKDIRICCGIHAQFNQAVINQNFCAGKDFHRQFCKGDGRDCVVAFDIARGQSKRCAGLKIHLGLFKALQTNFRPLGIKQQGDREVQLLSQFLYLIHTNLLFFVRLMGKIQTCNIHACNHKLAKDVPFIRRGAKGANNLGSSHSVPSLLFFSRRKEKRMP